MVCGFGIAWHLFRCRGSLHVVLAAQVCGTWWLLLLFFGASGLPPGEHNTKAA